MGIEIDYICDVCYESISPSIIQRGNPTTGWKKGTDYSINVYHPDYMYHDYSSKERRADEIICPTCDKLLKLFNKGFNKEISELYKTKYDYQVTMMRGQQRGNNKRDKRSKKD